MSSYRLVTCWRFAAPLTAVYDAIQDSQQWPQWWPGAENVTEEHAGSSDGIGSVRCYTWKGALPYRLHFAACTTRIMPPCLLEATVHGDLVGMGCWRFEHEAGITTVRHAWQVRTTSRWMNLAGPILRRVFIRNHRRLMDDGACALARRLQAPLLVCTHQDLDVIKTGYNAWFAGLLAGLVGGAVATAVQILLWWATGAMVSRTFLRDTRLAAAVLLGPGVLPPPLDVTLAILAAALAVHVAVSAIYGWLQVPLTPRLPPALLPVAGALYGLLVFAVNMYGFTALFPWFEVNRDWITAVAHACFGIGTMAACRVWRTTGVAAESSIR